MLRFSSLPLFAPGLCSVKQSEPRTVYMQPWAQFTVTAEINRVKPASCSRQPCFPCTLHSCSNVPAKGPWKGFTAETGFPSNCQNHCQVLLSNSGTSFPFQNSEIFYGLKKKKKYIRMCMCYLCYSVCVFSDTRGDLCFGLIYKWLYQ